MIRKKKGEIEWLEFELFAEIPQLVHGVFLRHGGVSKGPHFSLNAGGATGDTEENVKENLQRVKNVLQIDHLIGSYQIQSSKVIHVQQVDQEIPEADGLITAIKGCGLFIKHADCQATIFYDPIYPAFATVHAGWRGNVKNIYAETVQEMRRVFGSKPENLLVGVGPSLGPEHGQFIHYKTELPEEFWPFQVRPEYFDLWAIARYQLEKCGILSHHIEIAQICTFANSEDFYSYRRDKTKIRGNHATVACLTSNDCRKTQLHF